MFAEYTLAPRADEESIELFCLRMSLLHAIDARGTGFVWKRQSPDEFVNENLDEPEVIRNWRKKPFEWTVCVPLIESDDNRVAQATSLTCPVAELLSALRNELRLDLSDPNPRILVHIGRLEFPVSITVSPQSESAVFSFDVPASAVENESILEAIPFNPNLDEGNMTFRTTKEHVETVVYGQRRKQNNVGDSVTCRQAV